MGTPWLSEPPLPPPPSQNLDFDEVLGVLFGWQGDTVHASVDAFIDPPLMPVWTLGRLGVDPRKITDPFDSDEFEFTVGEPQPQPSGGERHPGGFSIHRRLFEAATLMDDDRLIIELREEHDDRQYELTMHIVRHRRAA